LLATEKRALEPSQQQKVLLMEFPGYRNKRVVVSGCFSGMGEATARLLLTLGAEVHGLDYKDCTLELASFNHMDLRDPASVDAAVERIGGTIDSLFNCAGLSVIAPPIDIVKVNYIGTRHLTERVIARMGKGGAIANISSRGGAGWPRRIPLLVDLIARDSYEAAVTWFQENRAAAGEGYIFSKEAVIVWTMRACADLMRRGIRINCTLPGSTQTPMLSDFDTVMPPGMREEVLMPSGRCAMPEEQAAPLVFLNSDAASYINGVALPVDGGFMGSAMAAGQIASPAASLGMKQ
jgi:NAD(P)-dependent dehydrogenase (short-subunit alcohol dehydrogenase family)